MNHRLIKTKDTSVLSQKFVDKICRGPDGRTMRAAKIGREMADLAVTALFPSRSQRGDNRWIPLMDFKARLAPLVQEETTASFWPAQRAFARAFRPSLINDSGH